MTQLEKKIIGMIKSNQYFTFLDKQKHVLSLFFMSKFQQKEYLHTLKLFQKRCDQMDSGEFKIKPNESKTVMQSYQKAKRKILNQYKNQVK